MSRLATIALPILALLCTMHTPARASGDPVADRVNAYAQPLIESGYLSGCLLVTRKGSKPTSACFGCQDADCKTKNSANTRLCIASITKPMTVVAILRLVEEGKLHLDDPVSRWLDSFPSGDSITVTDLLNHRAGISHRVTTPEEEVQRFTPADIVERIKKQGLLHPPHSQQSYSSAGYTVLAYIMERVTGKGWGDAMRQLVFQPLGMNDTFHPDGRAIEHRATSFAAGAKGPIEAPAKDYAFLAGAGSLYSTPGDVSRFANAFLDQKLLSKDSWAQFNALGWATQDVVKWSGLTNGFGSWLSIYKKDGTVFVWLGNGGTGASYMLRDALPALVAGEKPPAPLEIPARTTLTEAQMQGLEGGYLRVGTSSPLRVEIKDGAIYMGENVVYPIAIDRFFNPAFFSEARFSRRADGAVTKFEITAPGLDAPLVFERTSP